MDNVQSWPSKNQTEDVVETDEEASGAEMEDLAELDEEFWKTQADLSLPNDDIDDPDTLFDGNVHPAEWYCEQLNSTNPSDFKRKEYAKGTEKLIKNTEDQWRKYVLTLSRSCLLVAHKMRYNQSCPGGCLDIRTFGSQCSDN